MSTLPTTIASTMEIESFRITTADPAAPSIVWDESVDVTVPRGHGTHDAIVAVVLNVDHGQWDIVIPNLEGVDKLAAIDRAVHALTECRIALLASGSDTTGRCLERDAEGNRCIWRTRHDSHRFEPDQL